MGIHRINRFFVEEFGSPGDLRFRIETDIRIPRTPDSAGFLRRLRNAVESSRHERVRDLLLMRLARPVTKGEEVTRADLIRVRRLVTGALSNPRRSLPPEEPSARGRGRKRK
jgi:hypothetical protein